MPNGNLQLSPHFSLKEFTLSATAMARGINNVPDAKTQEGQIILECLIRLAAGFELVRTLTGDVPYYHATELESIKSAIKSNQLYGVITCAYRCPSLNTLVGGVPTSFHMNGCAIDFHPPANWTHDGLQQALKSHNEIPTDSCLEERSSSGGHWLHWQITRKPDQTPRFMFKDLSVTNGIITRVTEG